MQPFETQIENLKPQAKPLYPTFDSVPQQGQNPQYPQAHGPSYPQNYQPPFPSQTYQQPGGYPNYQAQPQPQYVMYNQEANQGKDDVQKMLLAEQLSKSIHASGKGLVALYSLFVAAASVGIAYIFVNQNSYQILLNVYEKIAGRSFYPSDAFSGDTCQAFLGDIIAVPIFLFIFAGFNLLAMCVSFTGLHLCMFIQPLAALIWTGIAVFASQQRCVGYSILTAMFGANNVPQNSWPYFAAMAAASMLGCLLNWHWSSNKVKAERDRRSLALMMAA